VVGSSSVGVACIGQRDGTQSAGKYCGTDAAVTVGEYGSSNAAIALAGSQHRSTDAAVSLVIRGRSRNKRELGRASEIRSECSVRLITQFGS